MPVTELVRVVVTVADPAAMAGFYHEALGRIEMHLVTRRAQTVRLEALDLDLDLDAGEHIRTEISRKFTRERGERLLTDAGFNMRRYFLSSDHYFALALAAVAEE